MPEMLMRRSALGRERTQPVVRQAHGLLRAGQPGAPHAIRNRTAASPNGSTTAFAEHDRLVPRGCSLAAATGSMKCTSCPNCRRPRRYWRTAHVAPPWCGSPAIIPATMIVRRTQWTPSPVGGRDHDRAERSWRRPCVSNQVTSSCTSVSCSTYDPGSVGVATRTDSAARLPAPRSRGKAVRSPSQTNEATVTEPVVGHEDCRCGPYPVPDVPHGHGYGDRDLRAGDFRRNVRLLPFHAIRLVAGPQRVGRRLPGAPRRPLTAASRTMHVPGSVVIALPPRISCC